MNRRTIPTKKVRRSIDALSRMAVAEEHAAKQAAPNSVLQLACEGRANAFRLAAATVASDAGLATYVVAPVRRLNFLTRTFAQPPVWVRE